MPEPTLDLLTADGRQLMASVNPTWGEPEVFTERAYQKMAALRDAIVAAARSAPVGELTEREVAEAWDAELGGPDKPFFRFHCESGGDARRNAILAFARRCARPSDAVLAEARREGWDAARAFANEKWGITQRPEHWDAERDRRWPAPPMPSVTLSDGTVVRYDAAKDWLTRSGDTGHAIERRSWLALLCRPADTGADFEAVKRLAAQVAPERAK